MLRSNLKRNSGCYFLLAAAKHALLLCLLGLSLNAYAQWQWRDASGRIIYSDQPPPQSIQPEQIIKSPKAEPVAPGLPIYINPKTESSNSTNPGKNIAVKPPAASAPVTQKSLAEREMEFRKRQAEQEKKSAEDATAAEQAKNREADCTRIKSYQNSLNSGVRISQLNIKGEKEYLNDEQREQEKSRIANQLKEVCSPG